MIMGEVTAQDQSDVSKENPGILGKMAEEILLSTEDSLDFKIYKVGNFSDQTDSSLLDGFGEGRK